MKKIRQARRLAQRKIASELFVVDPANRCLHLPMGTGEELWAWIGKGTTEKDLVSRLCREYEVDEKKAQKDVRVFLRSLKRKKLIEEV